MAVGVELAVGDELTVGREAGGRVAGGGKVAIAVAERVVGAEVGGATVGVDSGRDVCEQARLTSKSQTKKNFCSFICQPGWGLTKRVKTIVYKKSNRIRVRVVPHHYIYYWLPAVHSPISAR